MEAVGKEEHRQERKEGKKRRNSNPSLPSTEWGRHNIFSTAREVMYESFRTKLRASHRTRPCPWHIEPSSPRTCHRKAAYRSTVQSVTAARKGAREIHVRAREESPNLLVGIRECSPRRGNAFRLFEDVGLAAENVRVDSLCTHLTRVPVEAVESVGGQRFP